MASAARFSFTFNLSTTTTQTVPKPKSHISLQPLLPKYHSISPFHTDRKLHFSAFKSIDVSKEDTPVSEEELPKEPTVEETTDLFDEEQQNFDKRRLEEKFAVLNTGIYECRSCGYNYDEAKGDPSYPVPPGLPYDKLPDDWRCPTCGASKSFFQSKSVEIAGFAQNQQFGLGGNTLTSGQKALLIYGGLFLGFLLFLSGYFIQ
ncbi:oxidoreductase [Lithospermum erythrorhizon]|uniref:Oxidoreductase n=1 Tax=Lithospermum erythrorhizon TaxID=34254 RepID=A0AAV3R090_LITER